MPYNIGATHNPNSLLERIINRLNKTTEDEKFIDKHKDGEQSFSRDRFFTFKVLLCFLMTNLQKGIQREIALFTDAIKLDGGSIPEVSKSAFCRARKKLKPSAFKELSDTVAEHFYASGQSDKWHGYRVLGVDGSIIEIPNSKDIQDEFGVYMHREDGKAICLGQTLMVYDTLNHLTVHAALGSKKVSEKRMLMESLPGMAVGKGDILIMDRHYAYYLLIFHLRKQGADFCFRMRKDWIMVKGLLVSGSDSNMVNITLPAKDMEAAAGLGITETAITCRLVKVVLESGEEEILLTSLTDTGFTIDDMKELYGLRWPVEDLYKTFKHKMCIENFSGKSVKAVLQDFYVKVFIMNLTAVAVRPINNALKRKPAKVKYTHQVNGIEAIATMKRAVVSFFLTDKIREGIERLCKRMSRITEPIRLGRKNKRKNLTKKKHHINYKPV